MWADDHIEEIHTDEELDDTEIEQLEQYRRYGNQFSRELPADYDDDKTDYFTLPPDHLDLLQDWTHWRTSVNGLMSDFIARQQGTGSAERPGMLTSTHTSKTPEFFKGRMTIHGQRLKDQYGCVAIAETDDIKTKFEKKIREENFYLFGIPRISIQRLPRKTGPTSPSVDTRAPYIRSYSRNDSDFSPNNNSHTPPHTQRTFNFPETSQSQEMFTERGTWDNTHFDNHEIDNRPFGDGIANRASRTPAVNYSYTNSSGEFS